jgi:hypothetical protein
MSNTPRRIWKDALRLIAFLLLVAAWSGCENPDRFGPVAARCAEVVHAYLESPSSVEIIGTPIQYSEGEVKISYRTSDRMNIPVEGSASCNFEVGGYGRLTLMEASVDGADIAGPALDAIRKQLDSEN